MVRKEDGPHVAALPGLCVGFNKRYGAEVTSLLPLPARPIHNCQYNNLLVVRRLAKGTQDALFNPKPLSTQRLNRQETGQKITKFSFSTARSRHQKVHRPYDVDQDSITVQNDLVAFILDSVA